MNDKCRLILCSCVLALALPVAAAAQDRPTDEAAALEGDLGVAYSVTDGSPVLQADHLGVFCFEPALLIVDRAEEQVVLDSLGASDLGDGTWEVPDEETGEVVVAKVQYASGVYGTAETSENLDEASGTARLSSSLPTVSAQSLSILPIRWNRCQRIRRGYACGTLGSCPGGCFSGYKYAHLGNHLVCRRTGNFFDLCVERLRPVCRLDRYTCRDCTGPITGSWLNYRWVCATF